MLQNVTSFELRRGRFSDHVLTGVGKDMVAEATTPGHGTLCNVFTIFPGGDGNGIGSAQVATAAGEAAAGGCGASIIDWKLLR